MRRDGETPRLGDTETLRREKKRRDANIPASRSFSCCERLKAAAFTAGVSPAEAAYSSTHLQS